MMFESLKVENLMGCKYEIEFDPRYTVIVGDNRQGKTLTARLIMLALFGLRPPKELHPSWKLRPEELLTESGKGSVELVLNKSEKRYKIVREFGSKPKADFYQEKSGQWDLIYRKDSDIKTGLEEDIGITPGLMNVIMSNEQSLIGSISYDENLQASVWEGWKWRTEIIRGNIESAANKCSKEAGILEGEKDELIRQKAEIIKKWGKYNIFPDKDEEIEITKSDIESKYSTIKNILESINTAQSHYSEFYTGLIQFENYDDIQNITNLLSLCLKKFEFIDEKDAISSLKASCTQYKATLKVVLDQGGRDGISEKIHQLDDERKKLQSAKGLEKRRKEPLKAECAIYPPEEANNLIIQIPDDIADLFKYEEITGGGISVPYDEQKERINSENIRKLKELLAQFDEQMAQVKENKNAVREVIGRQKEELGKRITALSEQRTILKSDCPNYLKIIKDLEEKKSLIKRLGTAKIWLSKLFDALNEEESLKKIRKETVAFINRIYEKIYGWDINAELIEGENKIVIEDAFGNIRSHPSGSEIHIMGLAWRWMIARGFDLPLVLDELDVLLDEKNFERTKRLIQEEMDRQTIILTLRENLTELPGKSYKIIREDGISRVNSVG